MRNKLKKQESILGDLSIRLLSYAQLKQKTIAHTGEFMGILGITKTQERNLLSRLAQSGFIVRLIRGVYLLPERIPSGGIYNPGMAYILTKLFEELNGRYQICGPACFSFYGFDDQIPNVTQVYNNRLSGRRTISKRTYQFIKTVDERLGSVRVVTEESGNTSYYSSKLRTLVDAVYDWSRFNSLPHAYKWIQRECKETETAEELIAITLQYGNQATMRRIGFLLEYMNISNDELQRLKSSLSSTSSIIPFIPGTNTKGKVNTKWGIIQNE